jgi:hypothetical protein
LIKIYLLFAVGEKKAPQAAKNQDTSILKKIAMLATDMIAAKIIHVAPN